MNASEQENNEGFTLSPSRSVMYSSARGPLGYGASGERVNCTSVVGHDSLAEVMLRLWGLPWSTCFFNVLVGAAVLAWLLSSTRCGRAVGASWRSQS